MYRIRVLQPVRQQHLRPHAILMSLLVLAARCFAQGSGPTIEDLISRETNKLYITFGAVLLIVGGAAILFIWLTRVEVTAMRKELDLLRSDLQRNRAAPVSEPNRVERKNASFGQRPSPTIFVSYRRADSADITGRITDKLLQKFGRECVFKDVDSVPLGVDFRRHIQQAVGQCDVLLAVIGREWMGVNVQSGTRRLEDTGDHVRIEIEAALERDIPVIPVLVQGAIMPSESELPKSLDNLAYRNAIEVRIDPDFHGDADRLVRGIDAHFSHRQ